MFSILSTAESWRAVMRGVLWGFTALLLLPIAAMPLGLLALALLPVALCGLPFLMVAFFGSANTEHQLELQRASYRPPPRALPAAA